MSTYLYGTRCVISTLICVLTFSLFLPTNSFAQMHYDATEDVYELEEIVITGTRIASNLSPDMPGVTIITSEDIDNLQPSSLTSLLKTVPSVTIQENSAGKLATIKLRGAISAGHTLVMVDGVVINDPSTTSGEVDLSTISINNIERVEIIEDAVTTSVGFGGMAGAINIITKSGEGELSLNASLDGSLEFNEYSAGISLGGSNDIFSYQLSYDKHFDHSISAIDEKIAGSDEIDTSDRDNVLLKLSFEPIQNFKNNFVLNYINSYDDFDDSFGNADYLTSDTNRVSTKYSTSYKVNDIYTPMLSLYYVYSDRLNMNSRPVYTFPGFPDPSVLTYFAGEDNNLLAHTAGVDFQNNFNALGFMKFSVGASYQFNSVSQIDNGGVDMSTGDSLPSDRKIIDDEQLERLGAFAEAQFTLFNSWNISLAGRVDNKLDDTFTPSYKLSTVYNLELIKTKFRGSVGSAYNPASLYQLYAPNGWGNRDLEDETSFGYQIGFKSELFSEMLFISADFFDNRYKNLIIFESDPVTFVSQYKNVESARSYGVDVSLEFYPIDSLLLQVGYAYNHAQNDKQDEQLAYIPEHKVTGGIFWEVIEGLHAGADFVYVSERTSTNTGQFSSFNTIDGYTYLNLNAWYSINEHIDIIIKGTNITNTDYQEIYGYNTHGVRVYLGARFNNIGL